MAKQAGEIIIVGTIADITFYVMDGQGYARKKSSLTGKRVKKDPRFKRTMQSAHRLARASQLASLVYRSLPREKQVYALFRELTSMAICIIKEGKSEAEVVAFLQQQHLAARTPAESTKHKCSQHSSHKTTVGLRPCPLLFRVYGASIKQVVQDNATIQQPPTRRQRLRSAFPRFPSDSATNFIHRHKTYDYG
jgi:hypothetical protein